MKKKQILIASILLCFFSISFTQSQNINFQNTYLKNFLLTKNSDLSIGSHKPDIIDLDNNGQISLAEANKITEILIYAYNSSHYIYNFNDLAHLPNLEKFSVHKGVNGPVGALSNLDLSNNLKLSFLRINNTGLGQLNITNNTLLTSLYINECSLSNLNISNNKKLKFLTIRNNQSNNNITDFSKNTKLENLTLNNSRTTSINVTKNTLLKSLDIERNPINQIDLRNNCKLENLTCTNTNIEVIDARNCKLETLRVGNAEIENQPIVSSSLRKIYLTNQPFSTNVIERFNFEFYNCGNLEFMCIDQQHIPLATQQMNNANLFVLAIKGNNPSCNITTNCDIPQVAGNCNPPGCPIINFPDPNFKYALVNHSPVIDTDGDGEICIDEAEAATSLNLFPATPALGISNLTGIEYFTNINLIYLDGYKSNHSIDLIDFSSNTKLKTLYLPRNNIKNINLTKNTLLEVLSIGKNQLTSIDVSKNTKLKNLYVHINNLTGINTSYNTELISLSIEFNKITNLDISKNTKLQGLRVDHNKITNLDISKNTKLQSLRVGDNNITNLDISKNINLTNIEARNTLIEEIDLRKCNSLTKLNVDSNPNLKRLYLTGNHGFYDNFTSWLHPTTPNFEKIQIHNCPKLSFVCVNNVSFLNDIKTFITNMYPSCVVSTDCSNTTPITNFNTYFILSPNPTDSYLYLKMLDPGSVTASSASVHNAQTGALIKNVILLFDNGELTPFKSISDKIDTGFNTPIKNGPIDLEGPILFGSAPIDANDLQRGTYILRVYTNKGAFSTTFIKSTDAIR